MKKRFSELKPGQKFRYQRKLFVKDSLNYPVQLSTGCVTLLKDQSNLNSMLVTPVKVKITVKG